MFFKTFFHHSIEKKNWKKLEKQINLKNLNIFGLFVNFNLKKKKQKRKTNEKKRIKSDQIFRKFKLRNSIEEKNKNFSS